LLRDIVCPPGKGRRVIFATGVEGHTVAAEILIVCIRRHAMIVQLQADYYRTRIAFCEQVVETGIEQVG
jgi:hypothetical protein